MKFTVALLTVVLTTLSPVVDGAFNRLSTFFACTQIDPTCNTNQATGAEIVAASDDGNLLVYSDAEFGKVGFVNIVDPANPLPDGTVNFFPGQPNSVAVRGPYVLAVINTGNVFNPTGFLAVIDIVTRAVVRNITLPGQPDSITTTGAITAIAIENERNETLSGGALPQFPAGSVVIMNTASSNPANWTFIDVNVTGLPNVLFAEDPEPEYVAINSQGLVAVTLQENNAVVLINGTTGAVVSSFSQGTVSLTEVDTVRDSIINQVSSTTNIERQADGITWINDRYFATANEGDIGTGGSRTFSVFDSTNGAVVYDSGNFLEHLAARIGHYPESRNAKGIELETVIAATFSGTRLLFVVSERASVIFVYDVSNPLIPVYLQVLPCSTSGPEGIVAIPSRNLLVVANEVDARSNKFRSSLTIFRESGAPPTYPVLLSELRTATTYIPFSALSGLAASPPFGSLVPSATTTLYTIEDSFFRASRIMTIEVTSAGPPYKVMTELRIKDNSGLLNASFAGFPNVSPSARINVDKTVNLDPEGISISLSNANSVWIVSEGAVSGANITLPNQLLRVSLVDGNILSVVNLPAAVTALQTGNGYEGVAEYGNWVVITFQRAWTGEANPRLGLYNYVTATWKFLFYPLEPYVSPITGFTGLSDISLIGNGKFLIIERDSNGGLEANIKRLYEIDLGTDLNLIAENTTVTKILKLDMMPILATKFGLMPEKVEGVAIDSAGNVWVNNDNDGINNNSGEQQLVLMGPLYAVDMPSSSPSASPKKAPVTPPVVAPIPVPIPVPVTAPTPPVTAPTPPVTTPTPPVTAPVTPPVSPPVPVKVPSPPVKVPSAPVPVNATTAPAVAPVKAPVKDDCGILGLNIFCPFSFCGLFGRILGFCD